MTWVLIVVTWMTGSGVAATSVTFKSESACKEAAQDLNSRFHMSRVDLMARCYRDSDEPK